MDMNGLSQTRWSAVVVIGVALWMGLSANVEGDDADAEGSQKVFTYELNGRRAVLRNLVGEVEVFAATSGELRIEAEIVAKKRSLALKKPITFDIDNGNRELVINTIYPLDDYDTIVYRADKKYFKSNTTTRYLGERVRVTSRNVSDGAEVHVNYKVYVPNGANFRLVNAVGKIRVDGVNGDLDLDASSGSIVASNSSGDFSLDTGSGGLRIDQHNGQVSADTGSGGVRVAEVIGNVSVDTGSGGVDVDGVQGQLLVDTGSGGVTVASVSGGVNVDTGSGRVHVEDMTGNISVDTGSGQIQVKRWAGGNSIDLSTGSGRVKVEGDFSRVEDLSVDTGSGSVELVTTTPPSMELVVSANSGIEIDVPNMSSVKTSKRRFRGVLGEGVGKGVIDTGSGSVKFIYQ